MNDRRVFPDADAAAAGAAQYMISILEQARGTRRFATLAVSGGSTPKLLFQKLAASAFDWTEVHLFWVDERCVPPADPQSNYRLAAENLIGPARIPSRQVHRVETERAPEIAARRYVKEIVDLFSLAAGEIPRFDVVQLGMGADAHTASLFPGEPLIEKPDKIAAAVYARKMRQWRITLTPAVLSAARHTAFLVAGADKAPAVRNVFEEPYSPIRYPAQIASHNGESVTWFMDKSATAQMG